MLRLESEKGRMGNPDGRATLNVILGVLHNVIDSIDQGLTTEQIRESLRRIEKGEAIRGQDTHFFVLGLSQKESIKVPGKE